MGSTSSTTTYKIIEMLSHLFAAYRLPDEIVSDNGPQFVSEEMHHFMKKHWIQHTRVPSLSPSVEWGGREIRSDTKASIADKQD